MEQVRLAVSFMDASLPADRHRVVNPRTAMRLPQRA
jgi:hypothetical protein